MRAAVSAWLAVLCFGCRADDLDVERVIVLDIKADFLHCPMIAGLDALPLEAWVGAEITLRATADRGNPTFTWTAGSGTFSSPHAAETQYRCFEPGDHTVTVTIVDGVYCEDWADLEVTCTPSPHCGNGNLERGEQCDDQNTRSGDGCSWFCGLEVE